MKSGATHPDAYGRVTDSERYAVVPDAARSLIQRLVVNYDVISETGNVEVDFPEWTGSACEVIRLVPARGVPLAFLFTDFPGVLIRLGEWGCQAFPVCGCGLR